jgi:hypothetical protein
VGVAAAHRKTALIDFIHEFEIALPKRVRHAGLPGATHSKNAWRFD